MYLHCWGAGIPHHCQSIRWRDAWSRRCLLVNPPSLHWSWCLPRHQLPGPQWYRAQVPWSPEGSSPSVSWPSNIPRHWLPGRSLAQYIRTRPTHHGISGGSFLALERVITLVTVGTGCVLTGLLLLVNWGDPGWWRHGIVCSLPHSSPFSKKHPTQRDQQFQNFPAHFLPPPTKIASDHTKLAYSPVREPLYK